MRLACPEERLDCLPISDVKPNLECRDEIIPILRALQHLYADDSLRRELLALVGKDVNGDTSRKHGRRGMNYWEITVLAAARLQSRLRQVAGSRGKSSQPAAHHGHWRLARRSGF